MIKRILILVLAITTMLLLLTMGCDEADGVNTSTKKSVMLEFDEDEMEIKLNGVLCESKVEILLSDNLSSCHFHAISKKIGYQPYRSFGSDYCLSEDFSLQKSELNKTIRFKLEPIKYKIKFDDTFGNINQILCSFGDSFVVPAQVSLKNGYSVDRWYSGSMIFFSSKVVDINEGLIKICDVSGTSIKVIPDIKLINFKGNYILGGGTASFADNDICFNVENDVKITESVPEKHGSVFKYWSICGTIVKPGCSYRLTPLDITSDSFIVDIEAQWAAQITPDLEYCTSTSEYEFEDYGKKWSATITPNPHYSLPRSIDSIVGATYALNNDGTATISAADVCEPIRYAIIATPIQHKVTFDLNGGVGSKELIFNEVEMKTFPTPTKDGHIFDGWYDGDTKIDDTTGFVSDITLKAKWTAIAPPPVVHQTYLVRFFDSQGGNFIMEYYTEGPVTTPETPSRAGYEFSGWESTGGVLRDHIDRDTDYYATWNPIPVSPSGYVISFHLNEGEDAYYKCNSLELEGLPTPTSDGKRFDHWYYIEDGEHKIFAGVCNKDIDVYASWVEVKDRFHLDENGDVWFEGDVKDMTSIPVKEGYEFDGWYVIIEGERFPYKDGLGTDVYASWKRIAPPSDDGGANLILPIVTISSIIVMVAGVAYLQRKLS